MTTGRLRPVQRGTYRVGPLDAHHEREMAAVLACGPGSVLSHRSAATLWGLLPPPGDATPVDVTVRARDRRRRPGVRLHRGPALGRSETTVVDVLPTATAARTLLDLGDELGSRELEGTLARAEREGLVTRRQLIAGVARRRRHVGPLRALLEPGMEAALTWSEAEQRLLELLRASRLPRPEGNVPVSGYEVDFLWRTQRLVVEVDGFAYHASRVRFERDRIRDARLAARGFRVVRVTWRQIVREPEATVARLAQALAFGATP